MTAFDYFCQVFEIDGKELNEDQTNEIEQFINNHGEEWLKSYKEASELVFRMSVRSKFTPKIRMRRTGTAGYYSEDSNYER